MRESFIFYKSFYDAINLLGDKAQLKLYQSIMRLNFNYCENETELMEFCDVIESELKDNRTIYGMFLVIKPQLLANYRKYINGCKGAKFGHLGGAPIGNQNARKTTPNENENGNDNVNENDNYNDNENINENVNVNVNEKEKENEKENENENVNEKENENENVNEKENDNDNEIFFKKERTGKYDNHLKAVFIRQYQNIFNKYPFLTPSDVERLSELKELNDDLEDIIPEALNRLKRIKFDPKLNFTPTASWLLKGNNFERVMNGEFEPQKSEMELLKEQLGID